MNRHKKVVEMFNHCREIKANETTLCFLIAMMNDKELTKFHKEFLTKK